MGQLVAADRAHTASLDDGGFGRHRLPASGWHTQHWLWPAHCRAIHRQRRAATGHSAAAPDKRGALASVTPKTLRPTGFAGLHSSQRPSLVEKKGKQRSNPEKEELGSQWCSLMELCSELRPTRVLQKAVIFMCYEQMCTPFAAADGLLTLYESATHNRVLVRDEDLFI